MKNDRPIYNLSFIFRPIEKVGATLRKENVEHNNIHGKNQSPFIEIFQQNLRSGTNTVTSLMKDL
jgi:hypothetical protein